MSFYNSEVSYEPGQSAWSVASAADRRVHWQQAAATAVRCNGSLQRPLERSVQVRKGE